MLILLSLHTLHIICETGFIIFNILLLTTFTVTHNSKGNSPFFF